jgi:hypothetical protein
MLFFAMFADLLGPSFLSQGFSGDLYVLEDLLVAVPFAIGVWLVAKPRKRGG